MKSHQKIPLSLIFITMIGALGGFLFGYNTSVISGAILFLNKEFQLSSFQEGFLVSIILLGAILGASLTGILADKLGRRQTILLNGIIYFIGTFIVIYAQQLSTLMVGRFITGMGVGITSVAVPIYIAETSPIQWRGGLVAIYQLMVTLGILVAYLINYAYSFSGNWRWMFGLALIPSALQSLGIYFLPEALTPGNTDNVSQSESLKTIKKALLIGVFLSIFQQITGINAVIYYASSIFQMSGYTTVSSATFASIGIGLVNVIATLFSIRLLDQKGRKWLLLIGTAGMTITLALLSLAFWTHWSIIEILSPVSLMGYVIFFAIGLGPVTWVIISEIFPLSLRGKAMSIATFANWVCNYIVALTFLDLINIIGKSGTFALYAIISLIAFGFINKYIIETKGKSLDEIQKSYK